MKGAFLFYEIFSLKKYKIIDYRNKLIILIKMHENFEFVDIK